MNSSFITSRPGHLGPLFGFFNSNASSVNVGLFMCHQHEHGRHFGIMFLGLMPCQQYFRYMKMTYHRIVLPMPSAGAREILPCSIAFLTMVITKAMGINLSAPGLTISRMVSEQLEML